MKKKIARLHDDMALLEKTKSLRRSLKLELCKLSDCSGRKSCPFVKDPSGYEKRCGKASCGDWDLELAKTALSAMKGKLIAKDKVVATETKGEDKSDVRKALESLDCGLKQRLCMIVECPSAKLVSGSCPFFVDPRGYEKRCTKEVGSGVTCHKWTGYANVKDEIDKLKLVSASRVDYLEHDIGTMSDVVESMSKRWGIKI